jgi:hypothetical protein
MGLAAQMEERYRILQHGAKPPTKLQEQAANLSTEAHFRLRIILRFGAFLASNSDVVFHGRRVTGLWPTEKIQHPDHPNLDTYHRGPTSFTEALYDLCWEIFCNEAYDSLKNNNNTSELVKGCQSNFPILLTSWYIPNLHPLYPSTVGCAVIHLKNWQNLVRLQE